MTCRGQIPKVTFSLIWAAVGCGHRHQRDWRTWKCYIFQRGHPIRATSEQWKSGTLHQSMPSRCENIPNNLSPWFAFIFETFSARKLVIGPNHHMLSLGEKLLQNNNHRPTRQHWQQGKHMCFKTQSNFRDLTSCKLDIAHSLFEKVSAREFLSTDFSRRENEVVFDAFCTEKPQIM